MSDESIAAIHSPESTDKTSLSIVLENLKSSPFLSQEQFQHAVLEVLQSQLSPAFNEDDQRLADLTNQMAEMVLLGNLERLLFLISEAQILITHQQRSLPSGNKVHRRYLNSSAIKSLFNYRLERFRTMVVEILSTSKNIAQMDARRRR